ncbi:hypothetical protein [Brevibacterium aurantiacum]|nr:hypothetical protein [Brevibacterium aurantiacum]
MRAPLVSAATLHASAIGRRASEAAGNATDRPFPVIETVDGI